METTEHITESYIRYVKNWLTMPNIKCANGNEIDIIAYDSQKNIFYHIECGVTFMSHWALKSKPLKSEYNPKTKKYSRRNSVDFFVDKKFNHKNVKEKLKELKFKNTRNIIVCWKVKDNQVINYAKSKKVEIWQMKDFIGKFSEDLKLDNKYYVDDIVRTIQLVKKSEKEV